MKLKLWYNAMKQISQNIIVIGINDFEFVCLLLLLKSFDDLRDEHAYQKFECQDAES